MKPKETIEAVRTTSAELAALCKRESNMNQFARFWEQVSHVAGNLFTEGAQREELIDLGNKIGAVYNYHPGEFLDMYIIRPNPDEQRAANDAFDKLRDRMLFLAGAIIDLGESM
ncbi:MAG TPA: hypothetical protein PLF40_05435 [Kofleriaceae bacterium]|nr:hypothetical protein [Kofleriaceae bacterium]